MFCHLGGLVTPYRHAIIWCFRHTMMYSLDTNNKLSPCDTRGHVKRVVIQIITMSDQEKSLCP